MGREKRGVALEREVLFASSFRLLPDYQDYRSSAIAHIVLRNIQELVRRGIRATVKSLSGSEGYAGSLRLRYAEVLEADRNLEKQGLVENRGGTRLRSQDFVLTEQGADYLFKEDNATSTLIDRVCSELFGDSETSDKQWRTAFLSLICTIFSALGREYVSVVAGRKCIGASIGLEKLREYARKAARQHSEVDEAHLARKALEFFTRKEPEFTQFKWHLAHGYYLLVALGFGKGASALSSSFLDGKRLLLDTNVLFPALFTNMPRHFSLSQLADICENHGVRLAISRPTLEEFRQSVLRQASDARKVADKIPEQLAEKVSDPLYYEIRAAEETSPGMTLDEILTRFSDPARLVREAVSIDVLDDVWFKTAINAPEMPALVEHISETYLKVKGRRKSYRIAGHDALMLLYVAKERARGEDVLFVTLDTSLPHCEVAAVDYPGTLAIPLDALLHVVYTAGAALSPDGDLEDAFANALAERLLPMQTVIKLADFRLLDEFGYECEQMPVEELEDAITHLRKLLEFVDPTTAEGREKLGHEMRRFFASPDRLQQRALDEARDKQREAEGQAVLYKRRFWQAVLVGGGFAVMILGLALSYFLGTGSTLGERFKDGFSLLAVSGFLAVLIVPIRGIWSRLKRIR